MQTTEWSVAPVSVPGDSRVAGMYNTPYLADAYAIRLPDDAIPDPEVLARFMFAHQPSWVAGPIRCLPISTATETWTSWG